MRRVSKKTAARNREAKPVRDGLVAEVGHCEACGHDPLRVRPGSIRWRLVVHEIARGRNRHKALDKRYATLVACWPCNQEELTSAAEWPEARQLAALRRSRPKDFDLWAYNVLVGRGMNRITEEDVDAWDVLED